ncbi:MAG: hypothetical protein ACJZ45_06930 [Nitrospinia bacterium]
MKSPEALREINGVLLSRELVRPKIKIRNAHRISFGTFFFLKYAGIWTQAIMVAGNIQASRIATFPIRGGQLLIAWTEKINIKRVDRQKILKTQLL